ncbi:abortive infection family protein [Bacteroides acidifaciens]|uniref:abortive infection family protein n=1 Tax=Bacteroides acidifaciens TaxID=85831 RepID=UPI001C3C3F99|nr:abortive infection family protein [Bacteroides acidifaciens]
MLWIRKYINQTPSFNYFETHISTIEKTVETNPALCIETCKSLVESICKTILANQNIEHDNYGQFQALVKQTINCLIDANECYKDDLCELARRIASVSQKLAEIRNISGFASHGQDINHISMSTTMSLLAYKITDVLGGFIIHYYINHASKRDSRIHYEDCQEFNELINDNLEQQAQALFKAWFVDFEPFRGGKFVDSELGMIPEGWNIQPISSIFNFQEGPGIRNWQYVNNGTKFINIRCINNDIINIQDANMISDEEAQGKYAHFMLKENDIVISCSGTLGRKALVLKEYLPLCLNTSVIRFTPRINRQLGFLYGYLGSSLFLNKQIELASGSVQANFGPIHLKGMSIAIPDNNVLNQFSDIVNSIIQKKKNIISESLRLTNLRDSILPKLMSGKIKIDKLNS